MCSVVEHQVVVGTVRKAHRNQMLQSLNFHATEKTFDRSVTDPSWFLSFFPFKDCIRGGRMC